VSIPLGSLRWCHGASYYARDIEADLTARRHKLSGLLAARLAGTNDLDVG
jgi:hypothetical protein